MLKSIEMYSFLNAFILFTLAYAQNEAQFYYSPVRDTCQWGSTTISAPNNTANGGLCAYVAKNQRLYACPAPDANCWTKAETCNNNGLAGNGQNQCSSNGASWCCAADETCPTTSGQVNVCLSIFTNLEMDYTPEQAQALEYASIASTKIGTAAVTATPTPFYAMPITATVTPTSLPSSFPTSMVTSTQSSISTKTTSTPTSTNSPNVQKSSDSSDPTSSPGFIAGITIGAVGFFAALVAIAILLYRAHRRRTQKRNSVSTLEAKDYSEFDSNPFSDGSSQRMSSIFTEEYNPYKPPTRTQSAEAQGLLTRLTDIPAPTGMSQVHTRQTN